MIEKYEKVPRTLQTAPEKELIHLLPIKDKSGIIPQAREKPGEPRAWLPSYTEFSLIEHGYFYLFIYSKFNYILAVSHTYRIRVAAISI